jgi:guanylate kinase
MIGNLIIISSPSGGGKGTLIREVLAGVPDIGYSVSFTTRAKRIGEEDGRDYYFISRTEFDKLASRGELLEYAEVHGNFYGTSLRTVEEMVAGGKDVILEIDVQGAELVINKMPGAVSIFIMPPNFEVLRARLVARATETPEALALRLRNSIDEMRRYSIFDYVVVNDEIVVATNRLKSVILGERQKRTRQLGTLKDILDSFDVSKVNVSGDNT